MKRANVMTAAWRDAARGAALAAALAAAGAQAQTDTAQIVSAALAAAPACMAWRVSGVCLWLVCGWRGCRVVTSVRVSNYAPDLVVSTFHDAATHPWSDFGRPLAAAGGGLAAGLLGNVLDSAGTRTRDVRRDRNKQFRDADAIGHPTAAAALVDRAGLVCRAVAVTPFRPYFQSFADALVWRALLPVEMLHPAALVPGMREIGHFPANTWGSIYPRDGNVTQQHEVKGAAVLAQRVGDIVTRAGQPHVYSPVGSGGTTVSDGVRYWLPPELRENDAATGWWQMVSPGPAGSCEAFGHNDTLSPRSWGDGLTDPASGYVFNLWRPYSCCAVRGRFIGAIVF